MIVFCKFSNGAQSGLDSVNHDELIGFVRGLDLATRSLGQKVWITTSLPNEAGIDNDAWLTAENWLEDNA